ncbi:MAG: alpha/beta hydrolase [Trichodesmium sp. St16_bin4-tuft]|nr:alpha/beta hydrolase [Trichodesmium sp. ALOHA_ZT_67]MDE5099249.1 alpha/beta hydrolase [Trichodesmium sp. St16_bin4-tuft]MDE5104795.1 alpha/beta hydrolase [Trichodesmium sp. St19_bin2]
MVYTRKKLNLSEIQLSYLEWQSKENQDKKQPLLLLHGLADSALVWLNLGEYLADKYHIVAPDMRGHGESGKPESGYSFEKTITDLEALMENLNWSSANILGHSWTGKLACIWAKKNPEIFKSMILVDPVFIGKMPGLLKVTFPILYRTLETLKGMGPFNSFTEAETQAKELGKYRGWSKIQQIVFRESLEKKTNGKWGSKFVISARNEIFEEVMKVPGLTEYIDVPTLFIQPEKGVNKNNRQMKPYAKYLRKLKIEKIPGNHWVFLVEPEKFNQKVAEFLESI